MAAVAGLGEVVGAHEHRKDDVVCRQLLRAVRVGEQLAAAIAVAAVVFDVAVLRAGRGLPVHMRQLMAQRPSLRQIRQRRLARCVFVQINPFADRAGVITLFSCRRTGCGCRLIRQVVWAGRRSDP